MIIGNITSGTKEWADTNENLYFGCPNNCSYCYAKKMAIRFNRKTEENWEEIELNPKKLVKSFKKRKGRIMFPTSHDITPKIINKCILFLRAMLEPGNEVLITTKPSLICVKEMCRHLLKYRDQILFRFTITSIGEDTLREYEPNAPPLWERMQALKFAKGAGFKTSVSIEPFLDYNPIALILFVQSYVTDTIWIGKLNYMKRIFNTKENCKTIIKKIERLPENIKKKIRYKDSMMKIYKEMYE